MRSLCRICSYQSVFKINCLNVDGIKQYVKNHQNVPVRSSIIAIFSFLLFVRDEALVIEISVALEKSFA